jgi:hypothetical protein
VILALAYLLVGLAFVSMAFEQGECFTGGFLVRAFYDHEFHTVLRLLGFAFSSLSSSSTIILCYLSSDSRMGCRCVVHDAMHRRF